MKSDLFASRLTHQLPKLVSWKPDPIAIHSDAFSLDWASLRGYSPSVASTTLDPILLHLCIDRPLLFPTSPKLLRDNMPHPLSNLQLAGWRLSADVTMTHFRVTSRYFSGFLAKEHNQHVCLHWNMWVSWCDQRQVNLIESYFRVTDRSV